MIYQRVLPNNQKPFLITIIVHILDMLFVLLVPSFGLSDNNPTVLVRKNAEKVSNTSVFLFAPWKKVDTNALIADLNRIPWSILDTYSNDPDEILNTWIKLVLDVADTHSPMKKKRVKSPDKPSWLTNEIQGANKHRDHLKNLLDHGKIQELLLIRPEQRLCIW